MFDFDLQRFANIKTVKNGAVAEVLSPATSSSLGSVMIGTGVSVDSTGKISVPVATTTANGLMTSTEKSKLSGIASGAEVNAISTVKVNGTALTVTNKAVDITVPDISSKVDKVTGKGLSTNDYTTDEKNKLAGIDAGATKNTAGTNVSISDGAINVATGSTSTPGVLKVGSNLSVNNGTISLSSSNVTGALGFTPVSTNTTYSVATTTTNGLMSSTDKSKLNSVTSGAVTGLSVSGKNITYTKGDGTSSVITTQDTTYSTVTTSSNGLVPKLPNDATKFLRGDGAWSVPPDTNTTYSGSGGVNVSGTVISADSNYLGSIQKGTGTTTYLRNDGSWGTPPGTVTNTDAKVAQNVSTVNSTYPILLAATANATANVAATNVIFGKGVKVNPNTSVITATTFDGTATKASLDSAGNVISTTYLSTTSAASTYLTKTDASSTYLGKTAKAASATTADSATTATTAGSLTADRNVSVSLGSSTVGKFRGNAAVTLGVQGTLPASQGGTGTNSLANVSVGSAGSAAKLSASQIINGVPFDGSAAIRFSTVNSDAATVPTKSVTLSTRHDVDFEEKLFAISFRYANTADNPSLSVDGDIRPIYRNGAIITTGEDKKFTTKTYQAVLFRGATPYTLGKKVWEIVEPAPYLPVAVGTLPVSSGGTGQTVLSAVTVGKANTLTTARNIVASLGSTVAGSFDGSAAVTVGVQGTLPVARGGTGLTSSPSMLTNLGSTTAANVLAASPRPGVTGTLGVSNGGTGATVLSAITVGAATKASQDGSGNVITTTYAPINNPSFTGSATVANTVSASRLNLFGHGWVGHPLSNTVTYISNGTTTTKTLSSSGNTILYGENRLFIWSGESSMYKFATLSDVLTARDYTLNRIPIYIMPMSASADPSNPNGSNDNESIFMSSDRSIIIHTNMQMVQDSSNNTAKSAINEIPHRFTFNYTGQFDAPVIRCGTLALTNALSIANGGTGATTAANARTSLGLGAVATQNTLAVANGGTGMTVSPSMLTNLGSTTAANILATSPRPGVTGTLGIANGGTGATTAANARASLGLGAVATQSTLAVANGGTGQTVLTAVTVGKANTLTTARDIVASLGSSVAAAFNGTAAVTVGTQGILPVNKGGTGATTAAAARTSLGLGAVATQDTLAVANGGTGQTVLTAVTVGKANTLTTARNIIASLNSSTAASFNGTAAVTVGTQGTLPVNKGGTGATVLSAITVGAATKASQDGDGAAIASTYAKLAGATFTGDIVLGSAAATKNISLHAGGSGIGHHITTNHPAGMKILDKYTESAGCNVLVNAGQNLLLGAGNAFSNFYGNTAAGAASINNTGVGENIYLMADGAIYIRTGSKTSSYAGNTISSSGLISGDAVYNVTGSAVALDRSGNNNNKLVTVNSLAYWNGAWQSSGSSNLAYCNKGAFGTMATVNSPVPIADGGTAATTAAAAVTNLGLNNFASCWYIAVPSSTADVADKVLTVAAQGNHNFSLVAGTTLYLYFDTATTASTVTAATRLNINSTGLKNVRYWTTKAVNVGNNYWDKAMYHLFYNGTYWYVVGRIASVVPSSLT